MKKLLALAFVTVLALSLTACGGGNNDTPSGGNDSTTPPTTSEGNSTSSENDNTPSSTPDNAPSGGGGAITVDNWQEFLKEQRNGFNVSVPDGWTVTEAEPSLNGVTVTFNVGGDVTEWDFGETLFNESNRVAFIPVCDQTNPELVYETYEDAMKNASEPEKGNVWRVWLTDPDAEWDPNVKQQTDVHLKWENGVFVLNFS